MSHKYADKQFQPNTDKILDAILSIESASPAGREEGANLVDAWMDKFGKIDVQTRVRAVELGFIVYVDSLTAVIGVQDAIMEDELGVFGNEWKTAKEPKKYNGKDSWWWNEDVWLTDISNGAQVQIYALALNRGIFYESDGAGKPLEFSVNSPRIRVRAAVKADPPRFWPSSTSGVYAFSAGQLNSIEKGLQAKAESIRASRKAGIVPWQLTGKQCMAFGRPCQFLEQCKSGHHPVSGLEGNDKLAMKAQFDTSDPAARLALPFIPMELLENPEFVVLSASQYTLHSDCAEKYRIVNSHLGPKETTNAQAEGTVFHSGVGEFYKQIRDWQKEKGR